MSSHIADPLPAEQLAELSGCSLRQLQRCFSDHFGLSVMEFYRRLRLEKANELLRHSALPIAEITAITGFATMQHFSRCFAQALRSAGTTQAARAGRTRIGGRQR
ncbi:helix-turn-helix domain-containing protein [Paracoccus versutus]|nr:helix-turn-helix domain-containing protein [Paracoccus versutus]